MKILTIVGARPQFIKAAVVSRVLRERKGVDETIVHTGQHYDENMSKVFFEELNIPAPKYNLGISDMPNEMMRGKMINKISEVLQIEKPDLVLVYGDTNSTAAGAISAKQNKIKVAHVEAGMRSFDIRMPEELNRILADTVSEFLFCSTQIAVENLHKEGFRKSAHKIFLTGDVMYDATLFYKKIAEEKSDIIKKINQKNFVLATLHRSENVDSPEKLSVLVSALNEINKMMPVVLPLHPRTEKRLLEFDLKFSFETIAPVSYLDMIQLLNHCSLVMTDSGGLQKEAFFFRKHCITLREQTEWTELVQHGFNVVAGTDMNNILQSFEMMMKKKSNFDLPLYGDGKAGERIANELSKQID
jgi:UDP-GlcNAc3NAcA epimerase